MGQREGLIGDAGLKDAKLVRLAYLNSKIVIFLIHHKNELLLQYLMIVNSNSVYPRRAHAPELWAD